MLKAQLNFLKKELADSEAGCVAVKAEVELSLRQMNFITMDATLHAWAELMKEYKASKDVRWDPDHEIQTWKDREVVFGRKVEEEEGIGDGELSPMAESPKQAEPKMGIDDKEMM